MSTSRPFIPGLVRGDYVAGSRHTAGTPQLIRSEVNDGDESVDFRWQAVGSSIYTVTAQGALTGSDDGVNDFKVICSCPDGDSQRAASRTSNRRYVCKHAKAALDSVIDNTSQWAGKQQFRSQLANC